MTTRRSFIKQSVLAAGGLLLSSSALGGFFIGKKPRVIILGAGLAGLSAARYLRKQDVDVVVLEARGRIGGRVFSHNIDPKEKLVTELGGEWIGDHHTRMKELCEEFHLPLLNNQLDTHLIYKGRYYRKNEWDYTQSWKEKLESLLEQYRKMPDEEKLSLDRLDWWRYLVNNGCNGRDLDIRELLDSTDFGESIRHVSALGAISEYASSSPKNEMDLKIKGGNGTLPEKMAAELGDIVKLKHAVAKIEQTPGGVRVTCANGLTFEGDKIICTIPAFALDKIDWQPGLPAETIAAVNELQYARINKNVLLFRERFWKDEAFDLITDTPAQYFYHATKGQPSRKGALISYTIGDKAAVVAGQSEAWKLRMIQQSVEPFYKNIGGMLEKQENYYWGEDEYSRGAYAMYGPHQITNVMPVLKRHFMHTHFAGEHLADWQGFMEGAVVTGEEAAEQVWM